MSTLDRYIARQYLFNVLALLVLLFSFVVVVDLTLNIDRMFRVATKYAEARGEDVAGVAKLGLVVKLSADLWWPRLLQLFVFLLGMVLMAAMGFTISQVVRHRELVAMLASGISLRRAARPILAVAALMTLVQIADQEFVIPRIAPLLTRDHGDAGKSELKGFGVALTADASGRLFYAKGFTPRDGGGGEMTDVYVWERDGSRRATLLVRAPRAVWSGGAWVLEDAQMQRLGLRTGSETEERTPASAGEVRLKTDLDPTALTLRHYSNFSHSLSWRQLSRLLSSDRLDPQLHEKLERIRWGRVSTIVSNFLAMLIVMPFFLTREPKNMAVQSLKCAPVGIITLLGAVLGASAPVPGLPAAVAAFLPVMVLAPIAVGSLAAMKT